MTILSDNMALLSQNIFGSKNVAGSLSKSPIEIDRDVGPLSTLEGDPFKFSSISYPRDVTYDMQNGHYMLFYINVQNKTKYRYQAAEKGTKIGEWITTQVADEEGVSTGKYWKTYGDTDAEYRATLVKKGITGNILGSDTVHLAKGRNAMTGLSSILPTTTRITDSIAIYLPPNVQDSTGVEYEGVETGVIGLAAATGGQFIKDMATQDYASAVKNIMGSAASLAKSVAVNLGAKVIGGASELLLDVDAEVTKGFAHKAFGQATNPYMEVLFQNVGLRSFTYNFTFSPRNEDETLDVQKIIKMFRFHMLPELKGQNERYMTLPSTFDIHYMYQWDVDKAKENNFYSKIATCVLKSVEVDYTPGGVKSFKDGAPTQITMGLTFMETEMLTKQHVDKGY
jgi:hypothetical protein